MSVHALSELIFAIFRLNGRIAEWGDLLVAPLGLSTTRWQILGAIEMAARPLTAPQIAHAMGLTRQGVQNQLNALMTAELVEQQQNPLHERSYLYAITAKGMDITAKANAIYTQYLEQATANIAPQHLDAACTVLNTMTSNVEALSKSLRNNTHERERAPVHRET